MQRLLPLDGLRALSIALVLFHHFYLPYFAKSGFLGVDLFFVLSGFLITSLLIREYEQSHAINLQKFAIQRFYRLFPPFALMIGTFALFSLGFDLYGIGFKQSLYEIFYATFSMSNWLRALETFHFQVLGHTWSLAMEQQFYLIWPLALWAILRLSPKFRVTAGLALLILSICVRFIYFHKGVSSAYILQSFEGRSSSLFFGTFLALVQNHPKLSKIRLSSIWSWAALMGILTLSQWMDLLGDQALLWGYSICGLCATILIHNLIHNHDTLHQWMSWTPVVHVGQISYSLYLWHFPIFVYFLIHNIPLIWLALIGVPLSFLCAHLSWRWVELPIQKRKKRGTKLTFPS